MADWESNVHVDVGDSVTEPQSDGESGVYPRSNDCRQSPLSTSPTRVATPFVVSRISLPPISRWFLSAGSISNGVENCAPSNTGAMFVHVRPPSTVDDMAP